MSFRSLLKPARRRWLLAAAPLLAVTLIAANLVAFSESAAARPLRGFSSCGDLLSHYQDEMRRAQAMQDRYYGVDEEQVEQSAEEQAEFESIASDGAATEESGSSGAPAPSDGGDVSASGTNVQERGVDETDIFKTDGKYLYVLRPQMLVIAEIAEDGPPVEVGRIAFDQRSLRQEMLIGAGKVLVARQLEGMTSSVSARVSEGRQWNTEQYRAQSELLEIDVSSPDSPRFLRELSVDGDFVSARMVGGAVRVVFNFQPNSVLASPWQFDTDEEARDTNEAIIKDSKLGEWHPLFGLQDHVSGEYESGYALACERTYTPDPEASPAWSQGVSYMLSFDLGEGLAERGSVGVMSDHPTVYASIGSLYLATPGKDWSDTQIHRFDIGDPLEPAYFGSGVVRGRLLSQWSMSEHDGYLRVATTIQDRWPTVSNVFVLEGVREGDVGSLEQVGLVSGLGVTEDIFAVRFAGDVGYVVTFRQIDPLYVLDLSDPTDPRSVGELKIPGFSRYLHPLSGGLLLGIGRDADPQTGWERGLQASLFDVSDPAKPRQLSVLPLGDDAQSPVESDHKAFRYQDGVAWIPVGPADGYLWGRHDGAFLGVRVSAEGLSHESTLRVHGRALRALPLDGRIHLLGGEEIRTYDLEDSHDLGALDFRLEWDNRWMPIQPE